MRTTRKRNNLVKNILVDALLLLILFSRPGFSASEIMEETKTQVIVREHPRTGKPYVSIVAEGAVPADPFAGKHRAFKRPDYRMLDPKIKSGQISYDGPISDRKKFIFSLQALLRSEP